MNHHTTIPCISSRTSGSTPPNDTMGTEVTNHLNIVQVFQSQNMHLPSSVLTYNSTRNTTELEVSNTNPPGLTRLHHDNTCNYVIEQYCHHITDTIQLSTEKCKFNRHCIVTKTKITNKGENLIDLSPTVYRNNCYSFKKCHYKTMDTRLVHCFNKSCKSSTNTNISKCFHFICYKHMMITQLNPPMDTLELYNKKEIILNNIIEGIDMLRMTDNLKTDETQLIFPVCRKRCYNTVSKKTNKENKGQSEYTITQSWDKDGNVSTNTMSSIDVLINWITTEENASRYFGGLDVEGKTSANRKESYHHHIHDLIKKENGMYFEL